MSDTTWTVHRRPYALGSAPISHYRRDLSPTEYVEVRKTAPGYTWQLRTIREHDVFSRPRVLQEGYATTLRQAKADAPTEVPRHV